MGLTCTLRKRGFNPCILPRGEDVIAPEPIAHAPAPGLKHGSDGLPVRPVCLPVIVFAQRFIQGK